MVQNTRYAIAYLFFTYSFFADKGIVICDARKRRSAAPVL